MYGCGFPGLYFGRASLHFQLYIRQQVSWPVDEVMYREICLIQ